MVQTWKKGHFSAVDFQLIRISREIEFSGCPATRQRRGTRGAAYKSWGGGGGGSSSDSDDSWRTVGRRRKRRNAIKEAKKAKEDEKKKQHLERARRREWTIASHRQQFAAIDEVLKPIQAANDRAGKESAFRQLRANLEGEGALLRRAKLLLLAGTKGWAAAKIYAGQIDCGSDSKDERRTGAAALEALHLCSLCGRSVVWCVALTLRAVEWRQSREGGRKKKC